MVKGADAAAEGQLENDHEEKISRLTSTRKNWIKSYIINEKWTQKIIKGKWTGFVSKVASDLRLIPKFYIYFD